MAQGLRILGQIFNYASQLHADEDIASCEQEGPIILADLADVGDWLGLGINGRWKTRILGGLEMLPLGWPVHTFGYYDSHAKAQDAHRQLKQTIEQRLQGAPFSDNPHPTEVQGGHIETIWSQEPNEQGERTPVGILLTDGASDYDYAMHSTHGRVNRLEAGNFGGPKVLSFLPIGPDPVALATAPGPGGFADHVVLACPGGRMDKQWLSDGLPDTSRNTKVREVQIEVKSGILVVFWARHAGRELLAPLGANPAQTLAVQLSDTFAGPIQSPIHDREAGPTAWAIRVTPGTWKAQYWIRDDDEQFFACVVSREFSQPFQPGAQPNLDGLPPTPMQSLGNSVAAHATDAAARSAERFLYNLVAPYLPATILRNFQRGLEKRFWAAVGGCVTTIVVAGIIGAVLLFTAVVVAVSLVA